MPIRERDCTRGSVAGLPSGARRLVLRDGHALATTASASLKAALARHVKSAVDVRRALVDLALGYVSWAKSHREDFLLLFSRLPSQRASLAEAAALESPYPVVLEAVAQARAADLAEPNREQAERLAYGSRRSSL